MGHSKIQLERLRRGQEEPKEGAWGGRPECLVSSALREEGSSEPGPRSAAGGGPVPARWREGRGKEVKTERGLPALSGVRLEGMGRWAFCCILRREKGESVVRLMGMNQQETDCPERGKSDSRRS